MKDSEKDPITRSPNNPNGLYEVILNKSFTDKEDNFYRRISIVAADLIVYLHDVVGVDREKSDIVANRAVLEMLAATAITLDQKELEVIFNESDRLVSMMGNQQAEGGNS